MAFTLYIEVNGQTTTVKAIIIICVNVGKGN